MNDILSRYLEFAVLKQALIEALIDCFTGNFRN